MLFVLGTSHQNSDLKFREALSGLWGGDPGRVLNHLKSRFNGALREICLLSTCNRYEIYGEGNDGVKSEMKDYVLSQMVDEVKGEFYCLDGKEALRHLFRVASGLDSMVVGETEILGQVKNAYESARSSLMTAGALNPCFQRALFVGRRARSETAISQGRLSVASVAVELAKKIFSDFSSLTVAIVGAGAMGSEVAKNLLKNEPKQKLFVSRTIGNAETLAREFGGQALALSDLNQALKSSDIVVTQLRTEGAIISPSHVRQAVSNRSRGLFILDIALPRNVEEGVGLVPDVYLYNIDDLKAIASANLEKRRSEIEKVNRIVEEETEKFFPRCQKSCALEPAVPVSL